MQKCPANKQGKNIGLTRPGRRQSMLRREKAKKMLEQVTEMKEAVNAVFEEEDPREIDEELKKKLVQRRTALRCLLNDLSVIEEELGKASRYIQPTSTIDQLKSRCLPNEQQMEIYYLYPIDSIRKNCFEAMDFGEPSACDFAEEAILLMLNKEEGWYNGWGHDDSLLDTAMRCYLFRSKLGRGTGKSDEFRVRSAEFLAGLALKEKNYESSHLYDEVSKLIKGVIGHSMIIYEKSPSVKLMMERPIKELFEEGMSSYCSSCKWKIIERAILVATAVVDEDFIPLIKSFLDKVKSSEIRLSGGFKNVNDSMIKHLEEKSEPAKHIAFLELMLKELSEEVERRKLRNDKE